MMDRGEVLDKHQMDIEKKVAEKLHLQTHNAPNTAARAGAATTAATYGGVKEFPAQCGNYSGNEMR